MERQLRADASSEYKNRQRSHERRRRMPPVVHVMRRRHSCIAAPGRLGSDTPGPAHRKTPPARKVTQTAARQAALRCTTQAVSESSPNRNPFPPARFCYTLFHSVQDYLVLFPHLHEESARGLRLRSESLHRLRAVLPVNRENNGAALGHSEGERR